MTYRTCALQLTYAGYCALGGAANPLLYSMPRYNGPHFMGYTYWMA